MFPCTDPTLDTNIVREWADWPGLTFIPPLKHTWTESRGGNGLQQNTREGQSLEVMSIAGPIELQLLWAWMVA
jgi:hypothetical protein